MKKNYIFSTIIALVAVLGFCSCDNEKLNPESVFDTTAPERSQFDLWLLENFTDEYNIQFNYLYNDKESPLAYNVTPAEYTRAQALAFLVKYVWLDAYKEAVGAEFLKVYSPRVIQLIGSYEWNSNNSQVMGTAEGGMKVLLFGVNDLDLDNIRFNATNPYEEKSKKPVDMNYWFFHTMHHEFCHILTQTKEYQSDFQSITAASYHATDWINMKDKVVATQGFVTAYGSSEYNEDFAETYANYISYSEEGWNMIITQAGEDGAALINTKVEYVREYMQEQWNLDIDKMREIVQRRSNEVLDMNLKNIDFSTTNR